MKVTNRNTKGSITTKNTPRSRTVKPGRGGKAKAVQSNAQTERVAKTTKQKMRELCESFRKKSKARNDYILGRLMEISGKESEQVMRELIDIGTEYLLPKYRVLEKFRAMDSVLDATFGGEKDRQAMGFLDGKLVVFDGKKVKPVSLIASVRWYVWAMANYDTSEVEINALKKWLGMILKSMTDNTRQSA